MKWFRWLRRTPKDPPIPGEKWEQRYVERHEVEVLDLDPSEDFIEFCWRGDGYPLKLRTSMAVFLARYRRKEKV